MRCETRAADPMLQAVESRQLPVIFVVVVVTFAVIVRCVVQLLKKNTPGSSRWDWFCVCDVSGLIGSVCACACASVVAGVENTDPPTACRTVPSVSDCSQTNPPAMFLDFLVFCCSGGCSGNGRAFAAKAMSIMDRCRVDICTVGYLAMAVVCVRFIM